MLFSRVAKQRYKWQHDCGVVNRAQWFLSLVFILYFILYKITYAVLPCSKHLINPTFKFCVELSGSKNVLTAPIVSFLFRQLSKPCVGTHYNSCFEYSQLVLYREWTGEPVWYVHNTDRYLHRDGVSSVTLNWLCSLKK